MRDFFLLYNYRRAKNEELPTGRTDLKDGPLGPPFQILRQRKHRKTNHHQGDGH